VLLRLDDTVQRADLAAAETQLDLETANLERARQLQERGVHQRLGRDLRGRRARRRGAGRPRQRAPRAAQLVAPFDGTIGLPRVDLGQYIQPGTVVATLQDTDTMRVDFSLPEQQLGAIAIGQPVHVRADGIDRTFDGEIVGIDPRVDPASRMVAVRGAIEAGGALTPGQFVRIRIDLPARGRHRRPAPDRGDDEPLRRLRLRRAPLRGRSRAARGPPGLRRARPPLGRHDRDPGGIEPGETVVSAGQNRLSNGQPVVVDNTVNPAAGRPLRAEPVNISDIFIKRPVLSTVLGLLILLMGFQGLFGLQTRQYPEVDETVITVTTVYPGASAELIQGFVTAPIAGRRRDRRERRLRHLPVAALGLGRDGQHAARLGPRQRADRGDVEGPAGPLAAALRRRGPEHRQGHGQTFATMYLAVQNPNMTPEQVTEYIERVIVPRMSTIEGVAEARCWAARTTPCGSGSTPSASPARA
jgi:membrane fusion protein, multidrug efflux system